MAEPCAGAIDLILASAQWWEGLCAIWAKAFKGLWAALFTCATVTTEGTPWDALASLYWVEEKGGGAQLPTNNGWTWTK